MLRKPAKEESQSAPDVLRMQLVDAAGDVTFEGQEMLPGMSNYFIGNDPARWRTNIPTYRRVAASQVYPGVDLVYYGQGRQLEYDFVVAPGTDPRVIGLGLDPERSKENGSFLRVDPNGDLIVALDGGEVRFHKPLVYQEKAGSLDPQSTIGNRQYVEGRYVLLAADRIGFDIGTYDKSRPLIIDPVLSYSTYLGGSNIDIANSIAVSSDGAAFIAGETDSANFPTAHALQPKLAGILSFPDDAFVAKISPDGATLLYSTFLGGSSEDRANGIAVDSFGAAYVTGTTISVDYPASIGAADPNCGNDGRCDEEGGLLASDAFATKLNPEGSAIVYSTYISHLGFVVNLGPPVEYSGANDRGFAIAVDLNGIAYVVGTTDGPDQLGPFLGAGNDAFLTKISATGSSFLFTASSGQDAADFGGSLEDQALGVAVERFSGIAYLTGLTYSPNYPGCALGGDADALVMRIDTKQPVAGSILYSRCLGGTDRDEGHGIAIDAAGSAFVTGVTNSANFPTTPPVIKSPCTSEGDAFVSKVNSTASVIYSTCLGGSGADSGASIALDSDTNAYITGYTNSADFPTKAPDVLLNAFQDFYGGGNTDSFVAKLNPTGTAPLIYSSFLGGSNAEEGHGVAVDLNGTAYVTGGTCSTDFPPKRALQETSGGNCDAFVSKVIVGPDIAISPAVLSFTAQDVGTTSPEQIITVTSNGDAALTLSEITISGEFAETHDCVIGTPMQVGDDCEINVTFSPTTPGPKVGEVTITDDALGSPHKVPLNGGTSGVIGNFSIASDPTSRTIFAGDSTNFEITISPVNSFSGNVNLGCSGVPRGASCSVNPASVTLDGETPVTSTVRITTLARVMVPPAPGTKDLLPRSGMRVLPWLLAMLLLMVTFTAMGRRGRAVLVLAAMLTSVALWSACGAGGTTSGVSSGTPAGSYTITVSGISGSATNSTTVTLNVN